MARIWRGLKLGMKSLLLHKLRSGLTVLGIVFGVAAVISMLSIAEGSSREAQEKIRALGATNIIIRSVKPSEEVQASGGRPARILNYGLKYSDFDRMVAIIVENSCAIPIASPGKAALDAAERGERLPDRLRAHAEPMRDGERGRRVQRVVPAGHRHDDVFKHGLGAALAVANDRRKARNAIAEIKAGEPDIGVRIFPIGDDPPVPDLGL